MMLVAAGALVALAGLAGTTAPAAAQSNVCEEGQTLLQQRQAIIQRFNKMGKPTVNNINSFCQAARGLVGNGAKLVAFMDTNASWCRVPDQFVQNLKADHDRARKAQANLCGQAAKVDKLKKQAAQQARQAQQGGGGGGLLGGGAIDPTTAPLPIPRGAL